MAAVSGQAALRSPRTCSSRPRRRVPTTRSRSARPPPRPIRRAANQAASVYDQASAAFKSGDYAQAVQLDQQALAQTPNDTNMHEFLGLAYFAQGKYPQAAAPLYAVLSVRPGWDWTTVSGMYPDVETYTSQLRALEGYVRSNPDSAQARFVLAYQYLAQGHDPEAVTQLKEVVRLQPSDKLSAQIIAAFQPNGSACAGARRGDLLRHAGRRGKAGRHMGRHAGPRRKSRPVDPGRRYVFLDGNRSRQTRHEHLRQVDLRQ